MKTNNEAGYLVNLETLEISGLDESLTPSDFGCDDWAAVIASKADTIVDGSAWFATLEQANEYIASR